MAVKKKGSTTTKATTTTTATSTRTKSALNPSPNMASDPATDVSLGYSVLQLEAMLANYNLDAHSTLLALRRSQQLRLLQIQRHWATALSSLDPQIQDLSLGRFLGEFEGDRDKALRGVVGGMLREKQPPMGQVEQSARKRKRTDLNKSPARALDEDDPFTGPNASSKKLRHAVSESALKKKAKAQAAAAGAKARGSPSTGRKPRLRLRPSTSAAPTTSDTNFIYRSGAPPSTSQTSNSFHPALPPTPSHHAGAGGGTARRPRRGESIVLQSVNGSPLGEFVASDVEEDDEEDEEQEGEEEWDLMERNEASRVEEQPLRSNSKGKGKVTKPKLSKPPPSSTSFNPSLPSLAQRGAEGGAAAPSYDLLKQQVIAGMRADLEKREMSKEERKRLLESLERFEMGGM